MTASLTNDHIRDLILRRLYDVHQKARSPRSAGTAIRELQQALRPVGVKQQELAHNLDYLVQVGWVRQDIEARSFTTARGTLQSSERVTYRISNIGIDKLEAASTYQRPPEARGINITNISGVTVVGSDNIVNATFTDLSRALTDARQLVLAMPDLPDTQKLDLVADIDTLQTQLQKPSPNRGIVTAAWDMVDKGLKVAGLIELAAKIGGFIAPLLT